MLKEVVVTGTTTEEAIEKGCRELGVSRDDVGVEVLEYPKSKTFGLFGGAPAKVRVYFEIEEPEEKTSAEEIKKSEPVVKKEEVKAEEQITEKEETVDSTETVSQPEEIQKQAIIARDYLRTILDCMDMKKVNIVVKPSTDEKNGAVLELNGEGLGTIIGRRGEVLTSLQYLVSLAANNGDDDYFRISLNIGNYREKRENYLENLARKTAARALKINKNLALEALNPYERRIIHTAVQKIDGVSSWSVDEGAKRHVVIGPTGLAEGEDGLSVNFNRGGRGGYNKGGYNRDRRGGYNRDRGGYNKNRNGIKTYSNNYSKSSYRNNNSAAVPNTNPKKDTTAPLYGRITVPKSSENNDSE